jgi:hypothetical protein
MKRPRLRGSRRKGGAAGVGTIAWQPIWQAAVARTRCAWARPLALWREGVLFD